MRVPRAPSPYVLPLGADDIEKLRTRLTAIFKATIRILNTRDDDGRLVHRAGMPTAFDLDVATYCCTWCGGTVLVPRGELGPGGRPEADCGHCGWPL